MESLNRLPMIIYDHVAAPHVVTNQEQKKQAKLKYIIKIVLLIKPRVYMAIDIYMTIQYTPIPMQNLKLYVKYMVLIGKWLIHI